MVADDAEHREYVQTWAALTRGQRSHVRRLVRLGMPQATSGDARVAVAYARFQRSRILDQLFWVWFVPGLIVSLGVASRMHPVVIGIVLALAAQAVFAHRNLRRVEQVNASSLKT